jgi:hypothetical protein
MDLWCQDYIFYRIDDRTFFDASHQRAYDTRILDIFKSAWVYKVQKDKSRSISAYHYVQFGGLRFKSYINNIHDV